MALTSSFGWSSKVRKLSLDVCVCVMNACVHVCMLCMLLRRPEDTGCLLLSFETGLNHDLGPTGYVILAD